MYPIHKRIIYIAFSVSFVLAFCLNIPFEKIVSESIIIASITIAIYMVTTALLIESKLAESMRKPDSIIKTKTKLGVLTTYLKNAVFVDVCLILDCCFLKMYAKEYCQEIGSAGQACETIYRISSSIGFSLLITTLIFTLLLFQFLSVSLLNQRKS